MKFDKIVSGGVVFVHPHLILSNGKSEIKSTENEWFKENGGYYAICSHCGVIAKRETEKS